MGLKWKKDGTAKCGPFVAQVDHATSIFNWCFRIYSDREQYLKEKCHAVGIWEKTETASRKAAERWLRKQAYQMLKDLGENQ